MTEREQLEEVEREVAKVRQVLIPGAKEIIAANAEHQELLKLRARVAELERENAGLVAALTVARDDAYGRWDDAPPEGAYLDNFERWLRQEGYGALADAFFTAPTAPSRYLDSVLEDFASIIEAGTKIVTTYGMEAEQVVDVIRKLKGAK